MIKVGIAGTAKNTGKTTFASKLINELEINDVHLGITSIGYDGEEVDTITGFPKPKYQLPEDTIVATSSFALGDIATKVKILKKYADIKTPLGNILLLKALSRGNIVLAGPSTIEDLEIVFEDMKFYGVEFVIADGAFNRMAPFSVMDGIVITTGLSRNRNIQYLSLEAKTLEKVFTLPIVPFSLQGITYGVFYIDENNKITKISSGHFLTRDIFSIIKKNKFLPGGTLVFNTFVPIGVFVHLVNQIKPKNVTFKDPISLLLSGEILEIYNILQTIERQGVSFYVLKPIRLICIAVNPCGIYLKEGTYKKECMIPAELLASIRDEVKSIPIVDIIYEDIDIYKIVKNRLRGR
ncbi:hypothetical protein [Thermococcus sp.]|uniref:hypothetical protein n=1 Tax=Thermococcus sp. TaxID=35749 RepID=UPI0026283BB8|nr:hypothetical protein [Thermococcus sp.]MCD6144191.1 hypothetical protein [Thermococcus sp.]